jgi:hypothetical protein
MLDLSLWELRRAKTGGLAPTPQAAPSQMRSSSKLGEFGHACCALMPLLFTNAARGRLIRNAYSCACSVVYHNFALNKIMSDTRISREGETNGLCLRCFVVVWIVKRLISCIVTAAGCDRSLFRWLWWCRLFPCQFLFLWFGAPTTHCKSGSIVCRIRRLSSRLLYARVKLLLARLQLPL